MGAISLQESDFHPRNDYVLLTKIGEHELPSGLVMPGTAAPPFGRISAVGPGLFQAATTWADLEGMNPDDGSEARLFGWRVPLELARGWLVVYAYHPQDPESIDLGQGLLLLREHQIVAVIAEDD